MAAECVNLSADDRLCAECGHIAKQEDCFPVIAGDLGSKPVIDFYHCICYKCGAEWVL